MALTRNDACRHFMNGAAFVKCLSYYSATHAGKSASWEVVVSAADMPTGQQSAPTDGQIIAVSDTKATTLYNAWTASVDANTVVESRHTGIAGTVIA